MGYTREQISQIFDSRLRAAMIAAAKAKEERELAEHNKAIEKHEKDQKFMAQVSAGLGVAKVVKEIQDTLVSRKVTQTYGKPGDKRSKYKFKEGIHPLKPLEKTEHYEKFLTDERDRKSRIPPEITDRDIKGKNQWEAFKSSEDTPIEEMPVNPNKIPIPDASGKHTYSTSAGDIKTDLDPRGEYQYKQMVEQGVIGTDSSFRSGTVEVPYINPVTGEQQGTRTVDKVRGHLDRKTGKIVRAPDEPNVPIATEDEFYSEDADPSILEDELAISDAKFGKSLEDWEDPIPRPLAKELQVTDPMQNIKTKLSGQPASMKKGDLPTNYPKGDDPPDLMDDPSDVPDLDALYGQELVKDSTKGGALTAGLTSDAYTSEGDILGAPEDSLLEKVGGGLTGAGEKLVETAKGGLTGAAKLATGTGEKILGTAGGVLAGTAGLAVEGGKALVKTGMKAAKLVPNLLVGKTLLDKDAGAEDKLKASAGLAEKAGEKLIAKEAGEKAAKKGLGATLKGAGKFLGAGLGVYSGLKTAFSKDASKEEQFGGGLQALGSGMMMTGLGAPLGAILAGGGALLSMFGGGKKKEQPAAAPVARQPMLMSKYYRHRRGQRY